MKQQPTRDAALARRALLAIGAGTALSLMGDTALYAVLPTQTAAAGVSLASVGILLSANRWVRLPLNGLMGMAYDRWPRRWLFTLALFIGAGSTALYAFSHGFWPLLVGRLLWGLAWSGIWVGGNTIILDVANDQNRGRLTGLYQLFFYLGATLGFPVGGLLTDWLGYHQALAAAAGVTTLGAVYALLTLPETRRGRRPAPRAAVPAAQIPMLEPAGAMASVRPAPPPPVVAAERVVAAAPSRTAQISAALLYGSNRFVQAGLITATLALLVQQRFGGLHWGAGGAAIGLATLTGMLLGLNTLVSMFSAPLAGHWSDRAASRWHVAARALVPGVLGLVLLAMGHPALVVAGVLFSALAAGSSQGLATTLLGDVTAVEGRGRALGAMHTFGDLCSAVAPPLAYAVLPVIGLPGIYLAGAAILGVMLVWAARLARLARLAAGVPKLAGA